MLDRLVDRFGLQDDAKSVVSNMKYSTRGIRSWGSSRVAPYIEGDYRTWADEHLAIIVMIETVEAVENAEAIMAVDGVVGCFIGPADLALSMGGAKTGPGTEHEAAMMEVLAACKKTGKAAGKHCFNAEEVTMRIGQGFQFLALISDGGFLRQVAVAQYSAIDLSGQTEGDGEAKGDLY